MRFTPTLLSFAAAVAAHGDHDQEPLAGPHESLWYNTLPGDGGTQVRNSIPVNDVAVGINVDIGRLRLLRNFHIRSSQVPPVSLEQRAI